MATKELSAGDQFLLNKLTGKVGSDTQLGDAVRIVTYTSSAGAGGAATEAMVLTGLAAADQILGLHQKTPGANNLPLLGRTTLAANALTCTWSADPGAGAVVVVTVRKASL